MAMRIGRALLMCAMLTGCDKPVSYYAAHPAERYARIEGCREAGEDGQDSQNAREAEYQAWYVSVDGRPLPR